MSEINVSKVLDLKGLPCPMPVVKISQEIGSVKVGEVIEVHTTDPGSRRTFLPGPRPRETRFWRTKQADGMIQIFVKRLK